MKKDDGKRNCESDIPTDAIEALARTLYPAMVAYFESEDGQREFVEWQAQQGIKNLHGGDVESEKKEKYGG